MGGRPPIREEWGKKGRGSCGIGEVRRSVGKEGGDSLSKREVVEELKTMIFTETSDP
jgi:hypothetical protein